jgi:RNA polymerase sigma-70 factor (ECF subfamily)
MAERADPPGARKGLRLVAGAGENVRSDDALLREFLAGDHHAFGDLVRRHERTVMTVVRRYAESPDDAFDLSQRAFLRAFEAARRSGWLRVRAPLPFRAWLLRIAVNLGKNHVRDARRWRRAPADEAERLPVTEVGTSSLERVERERAMRAAVLTLPRRQREVLTLRVDAELSFREVAGVLGITENNAKVHFHHAARRLREVIAAREGA